MAQRIHDAYSCNSASNDSQHLPDEIVERRVVLLIDNVNWLNLRHKHGFLSSVMTESPSRTNRVSIVLAVFSLVAVFLDDHRNYFKMVKVV